MEFQEKLLLRFTDLYALVSIGNQELIKLKAGQNKKGSSSKWQPNFGVETEIEPNTVGQEILIMCSKKDHNMPKVYRLIENDRFIIQEDRKEIKQIHLKACVCYGPCNLSNEDDLRSGGLLYCVSK